MGKPGRQANFELLRIIAMFMVVILHWNTNSGLLLDVGSPVTGDGVWSLVTESVCIVAVNVYVLISGYFLSSCTFSFRRVAQVLVQTLFYTVLIPPVLALVGVLSWSEVLNPYHIWNSIFPVQSGHYWFVSAYVVLCLLSPFFNAGLETLSQKRIQQLLAALLLFFCIGKSFSPLRVALDRFVCSAVPDRRLFEKIRDAAFGQFFQKYCAVCRLHAGNIFTGAFAASFGRTTGGTDLLCVRSISL